MATATINISMPDNLKSEVEEIIAKDGYGNASEFFRELVRNHLREREERKLEALLLEGIRSGEATPLTGEDMQMVRKTVKERIRARRKDSAGK